MEKYKLVPIIICFGVICLSIGSYALNNLNNTNTHVIGSDNRGYVTKEVYSSNGQHQKNSCNYRHTST